MPDRTLPAPIAASTTVVFALAEKSAATRRAYRSDVAIFRRLVRGKGGFGTAGGAVADRGVPRRRSRSRRSTVDAQPARRRDRLRPRPCRALLAGDVENRAGRAGQHRRTKGAKPTQKAPATAEWIVAMLKAIPDTLRGTRYRALLTLGFAGAFRRSELVALDVTDLAFEADGLRVQIRHSKSDQEGQGHEVAVSHGTRLLPVRVVHAWIAAARYRRCEIAPNSDPLRGDFRVQIRPL